MLIPDDNNKSQKVTFMHANQILLEGLAAWGRYCEKLDGLFNNNNNNMKITTINIPGDCEIQIVKKEEKKEPVIRTYQDLIDNKIPCRGCYINSFSKLEQIDEGKFDSCSDGNIVASEKVAKSMRAMAMISQLMPYYGGAITDEEWNSIENKYVIGRLDNKIATSYYYRSYFFLAFHTAEQRDDFLKYNEQLVKDYLMID